MNETYPSIANGRVLKIPLYHGTSQFFVNMIMKKGLGAIDIVDDWHLVDLLKELLSLANQHSAIDEFDSMIYQQVIDQNITAGGFNWRHGSVYVSAAKSDAYRYAQKKKGSEILTMVDELREIVEDQIELDISDIVTRYPNAFEALKGVHMPAIIRISNAPIFYLRTESGDDPSSCPSPL
jgi:hypothetical protein